ncbi:MAG: hypothetical protein ILP17_00100 [Lachnospiraceae bacterium]|nr:hypothetical protein [Lachnospiraceae bacterium]MBP1584082.1 hypothetical protein [Lachnospiraceae bacterium]
MREVYTYILEPGDYQTISEIKTIAGTTMIPNNGFFITKGGSNTWVRTAGSVDSGCRIRLTWSGKGAGRVKYLTSTPRRKYYLAVKWFSIILMILAWIFLLIEMVNGNKAIGDSRTRYVMATAFTAWMGLDISVMRNMHGFTKWFVTIFSYIVMCISTGSFIYYLVRLISGS